VSQRKTHIFVISDLHLGGEPARGDRPAFQMCTEAGRAQLVRFIE
jgi:D-Tyr-tRNAtyr deacylase